MLTAGYDRTKRLLGFEKVDFMVVDLQSWKQRAVDLQIDSRLRDIDSGEWWWSNSI